MPGVDVVAHPPAAGPFSRSGGGDIAKEDRGGVVVRSAMRVLVAASQPPAVRAVWDAEGELASVAAGGSSDTYTYTADGDRLIRRQDDAATVYLPGGMELTLAAGQVKATRYYTFNGQTIAVRTAKGNAGVTTLIPDRHGTAQLAIHNTTNAVTRKYTDPYGNPRGTTPTWAGDHGFLDKPEDTTGLTAIGARYYDPGLGRFISVDPIMDLTDPQQWHGYTYSNNNPITWSDPTGLKPQQHDGAVNKGRWRPRYTPGYTPATRRASTSQGIFSALPVTMRPQVTPAASPAPPAKKLTPTGPVTIAPATSRDGVREGRGGGGGDFGPRELYEEPLPEEHWWVDTPSSATS